MSRWKIAALISCLLFAGCSANPVTNRPQLAIVPEEQLIGSAYHAYSSLLADARAAGVLNKEGALTARVKELAFAIIPHAVNYRPNIISWQWDINVVERDGLNAFCLPGGKIAIYSGIIHRLKLADDEIAQVLAHEVAHALSDHSREKISVALASGLLVTVAGHRAGLQAGEMELAQHLVDVAINLPYSREAESEADSIGILLAARAGYNPDAAISLWQKMVRHGAGGGSSILSTHPSAEERATALAAQAEALRPVYKAASELRAKKRLPVIEYEAGKTTNLYEKGRYELPKHR